MLDGGFAERNCACIFDIIILQNFSLLVLYSYHGTNSSTYLKIRKLITYNYLSHASDLLLQK